MPIPEENVYVRCCFAPDCMAEPAVEAEKIDRFYATNETLLHVLKECWSVISENEKRRAEKFISASNRETFIFAHAALRVCLSKYIRLKPEDIQFDTDKNSKPFIPGNPVYFNISHANKAFVIAVAKRNYVGADIEEIVEKSDVRSIATHFFSKEEQNFIFSDEQGTEERFFLLWTRKESFLKAIGTGMVNHLDKVIVSGDVNMMDRNIFEDLLTGDISSDHYIYSLKMSDYYISVAAPQKAEINFQFLTKRIFKR